MSSTAIHAGLRVNDVIREFPGTVAVFNRWGIDSCCGGGLPLAEVASRHAFDLELLLKELEISAVAPPPPAA